MDRVVPLTVALSQLRGRRIDAEAITAVLVPYWGAIDVAAAMQRAFGLACQADMACALDADVGEARRREARDSLAAAGLADLLQAP